VSPHANGRKLSRMLRPLIASAVAAFSLAAGFHASVAAAPPVYIECQTPLESLPVVMILIESQGGGRVRDAVHHCFSQWGGHPSGAER
jgi:hypothetical protein